MSETLLEDLFRQIENEHHFELTQNPDSIEALEKNSGYRFPDDLKRFYRRYDSVSLYSNEDPLYWFLSVSELHPTRIDIYGEDSIELGPDHWWSVCNVQDGNYISINLNSVQDDACDYIDAFHETFAEPGYSIIVAKSFTELLSSALASGDNQLYFLQEGFIGYGDALEWRANHSPDRVKSTRGSWYFHFREWNRSLRNE